MSGDEFNEGLENPPVEGVPPPVAPSGKPNGADRSDEPGPAAATVGPAAPRSAKAKVGAPRTEAAPESVFDDLEFLRRTATLKVSAARPSQRGGAETEKQYLFPFPSQRSDDAGCIDHHRG